MMRIYYMSCIIYWKYRQSNNNLSHQLNIIELIMKILNEKSEHYNLLDKINA